LLVDYLSLLYRAFHSVPATVPAQGVYGFLSMLARLVTDRRPAALGVAIDEDWRPAVRVDALPADKTHRGAGPDRGPHARPPPRRRTCSAGRSWPPSASPWSAPRASRPRTSSPRWWRGLASPSRSRPATATSSPSCAPASSSSIPCGA